MPLPCLTQNLYGVSSYHVRLWTSIYCPRSWPSPTRSTSPALPSRFTSRSRRYTCRSASSGRRSESRSIGASAAASSSRRPARSLPGSAGRRRIRTATLLDELRGTAATRPAVLAAGEGAFLYLLGPAIREYRRRGTTPLRLLTRDGTGAVEAVRTGEAHLAVAVAPAASDGLIVEALTQVEMLLVMPRNHALARKRRIRLADLSGQQLVVPHPNRPHRIALDEALRRVGVELTVGVEASGWELMVHFVELGLGLAIVNGCTRIPPTLAGRPVPELAPVEYRLVRRRGSEDHPGAAELLQRLRSHSSDWRR